MHGFGLCIPRKGPCPAPAGGSRVSVPCGPDCTEDCSRAGVVRRPLSAVAQQTLTRAGLGVQASGNLEGGIKVLPF